ncbi:MAG: hypothetical protein CFE44_09520 [Burkholderiales bacterium PBB4]|nr:MAG: hypothetical protein CFE44_09520 [Burkholderiales bacterium PBB4]
MATFSNRATVSAVFVANGPRHQIPDCAVFPKDVGLVQLVTKVPSRRVRVIVGNQLALYCHPAGSLQDEQELCIFIAVLGGEVWSKAISQTAFSGRG